MKENEQLKWTLILMPGDGMHLGHVSVNKTRLLADQMECYKEKWNK